ncbi:MAG: DUF2249 domain-containing protein [Bacteriovorax sp.]|nr:DUF2249 domain-containing protein [Bacteriovorax sp.]
MNDMIIDAQKIPGPVRHATIFQTFAELQIGSSLVIINNHDPRPLLNQFTEQMPGQFTQEYLAQGPIEWKVKITKIKKEGCCGCCG